MNIELRDFLASQIISGTPLTSHYTGSYRKDVSIEGEFPKHKMINREKATQERMAENAKLAYMVADAMIEARKPSDIHSFTVKKKHLDEVIFNLKSISAILSDQHGSGSEQSGDLTPELWTIGEIIEELQKPK